MPWLVVGALVVLVIYMARKTPATDPNQSMTQSMGSDTSVSSRGASFPQSPAMAAGNGQMSKANQLRLGTNFKITSMNQSRVAMQPAMATTVFDQGSMGPTDAESSLPTAEAVPTPGYKLAGGGLVLNNTSTTIRKL